MIFNFLPPLDSDSSNVTDDSGDSVAELLDDGITSGSEPDELSTSITSISASVAISFTVALGLDGTSFGNDSTGERWINRVLEALELEDREHS